MSSSFCWRARNRARSVDGSDGVGTAGALGEGARVGAGSVVLSNVEPHITVAGIPAVKVGKPRTAQPALEMTHELNHDHGE